MTKTLTAYKWYYNEDTQTFTGKEYVVDFHPEVGVECIVSVNAVEKHSNKRIDITFAEVIGNSLDATIDGLFDWDEKYRESERLYAGAKALAIHYAKTFRS